MASGCEAPSPYDGTADCKRKAKWMVMVGTRKMDATFTCGYHLAGVCSAMASAELPRQAQLTVTPVS